MKNMFSRSLTMCFWTTCNLKISWKNVSATYLFVYSKDMTMTWVNCFGLFTTTKIQYFPFTFGSPIMKSVKILSHFSSGIDNDYSSGVGWVCFVLFHWKMAHSATCLQTSPLMLFHANLSRNFLSVLNNPCFLAMGESWMALTILTLSCNSETKNIFPF